MRISWRRTLLPYIKMSGRELSKSGILRVPVSFQGSLGTMQLTTLSSWTGRVPIAGVLMRGRLFCSIWSLSILWRIIPSSGRSTMENSPVLHIWHVIKSSGLLKIHHLRTWRGRQHSAFLGNLSSKDWPRCMLFYLPKPGHCPAFSCTSWSLAICPIKCLKYRKIYY